MQRDEKSKKSNDTATSLLSVTEASYLDANILAGVDEDNVTPEAATDDKTATESKDAGKDAGTDAAANSTASAGDDKKAGDNNEANRIDDSVQD
jgi:hypothetical protein